MSPTTYMTIAYLWLGLWIILNYFLIRLFWVKRLQSIVLLRSPLIYLSLPSWKYMMWHRFWIWNDVKFLPHPEDLRNE